MVKLKGCFSNYQTLKQGCECNWEMEKNKSLENSFSVEKLVMFFLFFKKHGGVQILSIAPL